MSSISACRLLLLRCRLPLNRSSLRRRHALRSLLSLSLRVEVLRGNSSKRLSHLLLTLLLMQLLLLVKLLLMLGQTLGDRRRRRIHGDASRELLVAHRRRSTGMHLVMRSRVSRVSLMARVSLVSLSKVLLLHRVPGMTRLSRVVASVKSILGRGLLDLELRVVLTLVGLGMELLLRRSLSLLLRRSLTLLLGRHLLSLLLLRRHLSLLLLLGLVPLHLLLDSLLLQFSSSLSLELLLLELVHSFLLLGLNHSRAFHSPQLSAPLQSSPLFGLVPLIAFH